MLPCPAFHQQAAQALQERLNADGRIVTENESVSSLARLLPETMRAAVRSRVDVMVTQYWDKPLPAKSFKVRLPTPYPYTPMDPANVNAFSAMADVQG